MDNARVDDWDKELDIVAHEIAHVREVYGRSRLLGHKGLIACKVGIIQGQLNLERNLERIRKLAARDYLLLPREHTLLRWGQVYAEKVAAYFQQRTRLKSRAFWLRLIHARLTGPEPRGGNIIEPDDLVSLSIRQANLRKTERFLAEALLDMRKKRRAMQRRHAELAVSTANRDAGYCLNARLGRNAADALSSPTVRALETYVLHMLACGRKEHAPEAAKLHERTEDRARILVEQARDIVLARAGGAKHPANLDARAAFEFSLAMEELDELEARTRAAYQRILDASSKEARPILVQKRTERANT